MNLNLKKPCANCPFLKKGAIELREGRLEQIARDLVRDDRTPFLCHKTVHSRRSDGERIEHEDGTTTYVPGRRDSVCAGSMAFLMKAKMPNVAMRIGISLGLLSMKELESIADAVIDPKDLGPSFQDDGAWA